MTDSSPHPSFLALDRLAVADHGADEVREHAAHCARCAEYVLSISEARAILPVLRKRSRNLGALGVAFAAAAALVAAAGYAVFRSGPRVDDRTAYTSVKGDPAVALYVKRGERVFLFTGDDAVMPDDRLRLEIAPAGFRYVTVLTGAGVEAGAPRPQRLYEGAIDPERPALLPVAWRVDTIPGDELLIVVLSHEALPSELELELVSRSETRAQIWVRRLVLPKRNPRAPRKP